MQKTLRLGVALISAVYASPALALEPGQCLAMSSMNTALKGENQRSLILGDRIDYDGQPVAIGDTTMTRAEWMRVSRDIQSDTPYRRNLVASLRAKGRTQAQIDKFIDQLRDVSAILEKGDHNTPVPRYMMAFASNADGSLAYILEGDRPSAEASTRACIRARLGNLKLASAPVLNADSAAGSELVTGHGDVVQINGAKLSNVRIALRGSTVSGEAQVVVVQPGNPPLFILSGIRLRPAAMEQAGK